jgi:hypothetical protein
MATAPWRCSTCGTINEPVANSCRTCGKWPSLFDLEDSVVDEDAGFESDFDAPPEPDSAPAYDAPEPVTVEIEPFEVPEPTEVTGTPEASTSRRRFEPPPTDPVLEEGESSRPKWVSWVIPLAVVAYFVISFFLGDR